MTTCPEAEDPHWLDPAERAAWLALTGVLFRLPSALDTQMQRVAGLSNFEYLVLAMLSETPTQTLRMSQLAVISNGSLSRLSHVVARLERQGYVRREQGPADGRSINAVLTQEGLAKVVATAPGHVNYVRHLVFDGRAHRGAGGQPRADRPQHPRAHRPRRTVRPGRRDPAGALAQASSTISAVACRSNCVR